MDHAVGLYILSNCQSHLRRLFSELSLSLINANFESMQYRNAAKNFLIRRISWLSVDGVLYGRMLSAVAQWDAWARLACRQVVL